jgi:hypothetical protein
VDSPERGTGSISGGTTQAVLVSVRRDAPDVWEAVADWTAATTLSVPLFAGMVPYVARDATTNAAVVTVRGASRTASTTTGIAFNGGTMTVTLGAGAGTPDDILVLLTYTVP